MFCYHSWWIKDCQFVWCCEICVFDNDAVREGLQSYTNAIHWWNRVPPQGLWRIEYLNTGRAETEICKQTGGRHDFTYRLFVRWLAKII